MATKNTKVEGWIVELCDRQIEWVKAQTNKAAFLTHQPRIIEVLETIKKGGDWTAVQAIFKAGWLPATLNGGWFDSQLQRAAGRVVDEKAAIVKVSGPKEKPRYMELLDFEIERGHKPNADMPVGPGKLVKCVTCDNVYAVKEMGHQLYCPDCHAKMKPGSRVGGGQAVSKMDRGELRKLQIARSVISLAKAGGERFEARLQILNKDREKAGLPALTKEQVQKIEDPAAVWG